MRYTLPWFLFKTTSSGVFAVPYEIAVDVGLLARYTDLISVEVVGLLADFSVFVGPVVYQCQEFVAVGNGLEIGIPTVPDPLKEDSEVE